MDTQDIPDLAALKEYAQTFASTLVSTPRPSRAYLVTLSGDLGAGKTTFVQYLAKECGVSETVQSPTFVLAKSYMTRVSWPARILHIDAYRLEGPDALLPLGWKREMEDERTLVLLEWPEKVSPLTPSPDLALKFSVTEGGGRSIALSRAP